MIFGRLRDLSRGVADARAGRHLMIFAAAHSSGTQSCFVRNFTGDFELGIGPDQSRSGRTRSRRSRTTLIADISDST